MKQEYKDWIAKNVDGIGHRKCAEVTSAMVESFPELTRVRGHYHDLGDARPHWWLKTANGEIVDPTAAQFRLPSADFLYEEWDESQPEPTGKCSNCGGYCYDGAAVCSEACHESYRAYLMGGEL